MPPVQSTSFAQCSLVLKLFVGLHNLSLVLEKKKKALSLLLVLTHNADRRHEHVLRKILRKRAELNKLNNGYFMKDLHAGKG